MKMSPVALPHMITQKNIVGKFAFSAILCMKSRFSAGAVQDKGAGIHSFRATIYVKTKNPPRLKQISACSFFLMR